MAQQFSWKTRPRSINTHSHQYQELQARTHTSTKEGPILATIDLVTEAATTRPFNELHISIEIFTERATTTSEIELPRHRDTDNKKSN